MGLERIRNFSIIAHIDHGKSTLADRIIEHCEAVEKRSMKAQFLDDMDIERERGITIKARTMTLRYEDRKSGNIWRFNLIDTPGHVDFVYEVSRSLEACEGALLVVDAAQGVEAQTLANVYLALDAGLEIVPVINKIDLPAACAERTIREIEDIVGIPADDALLVSAKTGQGIPELLEAIVERIPAPEGRPEAPLKALVIDSHFDPYRGVIVYIRVFDGAVRKGDEALFMRMNTVHEVDETGIFSPKMTAVDVLKAGDTGYFVAGIKEIGDVQIGDTATLRDRPADCALPGYREMKPVVFCGMYPVDTSRYTVLREALEKLRLNDSSFSFVPETSQALGFGFRCGFLGVLHLEIIQERLEREFEQELVVTAPSVVYKVVTRDGTANFIDNPVAYPDPSQIESVEEPFVDLKIYTPKDYVGPLMELAQDRRGEFGGMKYLDANRMELSYLMPLAELILDFYDKLKARSRGYASLEYDFAGLKETEVVKLDVLINAEPVDALCFLVHKDKAYPRARQLVEKLRELIPRQQFKVPVQAAVGGKIIARETVSSIGKNVLAKCYGGDVTRKRKLLEKQKAGKKRLKEVGSVEIPQSAFMAVLKLD